MTYALFDDDPPEGEPEPDLLLSEFGRRLLDAKRQGSPLWLLDSAVLLLETGRTGPAMPLLRELRSAITGCTEAVYQDGLFRGRERAEKAARASAAPPLPAAAPRAPEAPQRPAIPAHRRQAAELAEHVGRLGAERVAAILGVRPADLAALLAGRAAVSKGGMKRLREMPC